MENCIFKFSDYDCIGFDLDNTLAMYKINQMVEMEYKILVKFLVHKGYSDKHLKKPIDYDFLLRGLVLDVDKGNILKLAGDGNIISATHGTRLLTQDELKKNYANCHWKLADLFVKNPLETWDGPISERICSLLDYYDTVVSLIFARLVDTKDEESKEPILKYTVYSDIYEGLVDMFTIDNSQPSKGEYYREVASNPDKYYYKCSEKLLNWLRNLKKQGKLLYLLTDSYVDFASSTASYCLGPNWKDYFDIIITNGHKPGFFNKSRNFRGLNGFKETGVVSTDKLELQGMYTHGNWKGLHQFLVKHSLKLNPKFLYVGDHLIQDIYAPNVYSSCDTVVICEELADKNHPEDKTIHSTFWGSYFHSEDMDTIWYKIMKNHAKIWFSDMEVAVNLQCAPK